jgi:hypothetical protein
VSANTCASIIGDRDFLSQRLTRPWLECFIKDLSQAGIFIEAGDLVVPEIFGVAFN